MLAYAIGEAVLLALMSLALGLGARRLAVPYLLFLAAGVIGGSLVFVAYGSYATPRCGAMRFAGAIFVFMTIYMGVIVWSAYRFGYLTRDKAAHEYGPLVVPGAASISILIYLMERRRVESSR